VFTRSLLASVLYFLSFVEAEAHPLIQNSMWVLFAADRAQMALNVSVKEILVAQNIAQDAQAPLGPEQSKEAATRNSDYIARHLDVSVNGEFVNGRVVRVNPPLLFTGDAENTYFQYELEYPWPTGTAPVRVKFSHHMLREFRYAPGEPWDISYVMRLKRNGQDEVTVSLLRSQGSV
jgi:hypothetical protein